MRRALMLERDGASTDVSVAMISAEKRRDGDRAMALFSARRFWLRQHTPRLLVRAHADATPARRWRPFTVYQHVTVLLRALRSAATTTARRTCADASAAHPCTILMPTTCVIFCTFVFPPRHAIISSCAAMFYARHAITRAQNALSLTMRDVFAAAACPPPAWLRFATR